MAERGYSQRRACWLIEVDPRSLRREPVADAPEIRERLRPLAAARRASAIAGSVCSFSARTSS
jgi:putative transposase